MSLTFEPPCDFGRYRIERVLGEGGCGAVYLAWDTKLGRHVALKVPHPNKADDPQVIKRFEREAQVAARINHPYVCPVLDVGEYEGTVYLTMPHIAGTPLTKVIDPNQLWPVRSAVELVVKLTQALAIMHQAGAVHRDLKPDNIMLKVSQEPMILDFGLAWEVSECRLTRPGEFLGTPAYMSPEQVNADPEAIGPACDIYGLGVLLFQLLTGKVPFTGNLREVFAQIARGRVPNPSDLRPDLDRSLDAICQKAMAKKPEDRYASMGDFATALNDFLEHDEAARTVQEKRIREAEKQLLLQTEIEMKQERFLRLEAERRIQELHANQEALSRVCEEQKMAVSRERGLRMAAEQRLQEVQSRRYEPTPALVVSATARVNDSGLEECRDTPGPANQGFNSLQNSDPPPANELIVQGQRQAEKLFALLVHHAQVVAVDEQRRRSWSVADFEDRVEEIDIDIFDDQEKARNLVRRGASPSSLAGGPAEELRRRLLREPGNVDLR
jgi:hypothetical protein